MKVLIVYGTTEGHTREVCHHAADVLRAAGHPVTIEEATGHSRSLPAERYEVIFLAASLHQGRYQPCLIRFARDHLAALQLRPSAFISVSLSAAGENPDDWEGLADCVARFEQETGWTPSAVHHAGGAIRYSQYDFFKRLALQYIAARRGQRTDISRDYDLTDYAALDGFVTGFVAQAAGAVSAAAAARP